MNVFLDGVLLMEWGSGFTKIWRRALDWKPVDTQNQHFLLVSRKISLSWKGIHFWPLMILLLQSLLSQRIAAKRGWSVASRCFFIFDWGLAERAPSEQSMRCPFKPQGVLARSLFQWLEPRTQGLWNASARGGGCQVVEVSWQCAPHRWDPRGSPATSFWFPCLVIFYQKTGWLFQRACQGPCSCKGHRRTAVAEGCHCNWGPSKGDSARDDDAAESCTWKLDGQNGGGGQGCHWEAPAWTCGDQKCSRTGFKRLSV